MILASKIEASFFTIKNYFRLGSPRFREQATVGCKGEADSDKRKQEITFKVIRHSSLRVCHHRSAFPSSTLLVFVTLGINWLKGWCGIGDRRYVVDLHAVGCMLST